MSYFNIMKRKRFKNLTVNTTQHWQTLVIKDNAFSSGNQGQFIITKCVLAMVWGDKPAFPDQKALTARDETNSKPSQQSPAGSLLAGDLCKLEQPTVKGNTGRETVPFLNITYWPHAGRPHHCSGQRVEGSGVLVQSITPNAKPRANNLHMIFFLRAICHTFPWGDHDCALPDFFPND